MSSFSLHSPRKNSVIVSSLFLTMTVCSEAVEYLETNDRNSWSYLFNNGGNVQFYSLIGKFTCSLGGQVHYSCSCKVFIACIGSRNSAYFFRQDWCRLL